MSEQDRKLFVGGLHYETSESKLRAFYEKWGEVVDCVVMMDPHTRRSRGFGFVTFGSLDSVEDALNSRPHIIDGKEVEPKRATPREETTRSDSRGGVKKVFVGGIGQDTDEIHLRDYFSKYGQIENASVMTDKDTGKSRGFGFVVFEEYEPADRCSASRWHEINGHRCEVKKAVPRQDESLQRGKDSGRSRGSYGGEPRSSYGGSSGRSSSYGANSYSSMYGNSGYGSSYGSSAYGSYAAYASAYPGYASTGWTASDGYPAGSLGSAYGSSYGGGPVKGSSYSSRSSGPYGGGYGNSSSAGYSSTSYSGLSSAPYGSSSSAYHGSSSAYGSTSSSYGASHAYSAYGGY